MPRLRQTIDVPQQKQLKDGVEDFLAATALWSTQWFNKPKFHLFLHLLFYIRRFGPALLYATEGFESFNFLIRLRSVHSNRHAPSTDITEAFSLLHAVRHLVSGGVVPIKTDPAESMEWRQAGDGVLALMDDPIFRHMMGMDGIIDTGDVGEYSYIVQPGCTHIYLLERRPMLLKDAKLSFGLTRTAASGFQHHGQLSPTVLRCHGLYISNGDLVRLGGWVFYASAASPQPHCGRVDEILLRETNSAPLGMLVCKSDISQTATLPYRFPAVTPREGDYEFISVQVRLGNRHTAL